MNTGNTAQTIEIQYVFKMDKDIRSEFTLHLDPDTLDITKQKSIDAPEWTQLEYMQCPHCPLNKEESPNCPVAICLVNVIDKFDDVVSYDTLELEVITEGRKVSQTTSAQKSISSLLGLMFATSGCPHTNFFKPMARFHLPLATPQETVFRATGMYLLSQYYAKQKGQDTDLELEGLKKIYSNLNRLNTAIVKRIDAASSTDSTKNAIVILDMLANMIPIVIEDHLESIQHLFDSYIKN